MAFDRHEILFKHYKQEIESWKWDVIEKLALENCRVDEDDTIIASCLIGSVFSLFPSGKFYMPWTTNQTRADETKDAMFLEALEKVAESKGFYQTGECEDIFLERVVTDKSQVIHYVTSEDADKAESIGE